MAHTIPKSFESIFTQGSQAYKMGLKLKELIYSNLQNVDEQIAGGAKVRLALYSRGGASQVLCGIQAGANDSCFLYVHHVPSISHEKLKFSGKGKHAKRVKFESEEDIHEQDISWLLQQVGSNAPY